MSVHTILWRNLDTPGHDASRLSLDSSGWRLTGTAVFAHEARSCRLDYLVECDLEWRTVSAQVHGWVGNDPVDVEITTDSRQRWRLNGQEHSSVAGCIDVDLNFSPSTNLLPIRRLNLPIGREATVKVAWLRFPTLTLGLLDQRYRRIGPTTYGYESGGGSFTADLEVNEVGFVTAYPRLFQAEAFDR